MQYKLKLRTDFAIYGLHAKIYFPIPPEEIDELYFYGDDISGDGRGLD